MRILEQHLKKLRIEITTEGKREFLEQQSNGELEDEGIPRGKSLLLYTRKLKKDAKGELISGQRIGMMAKVPEEDMFDDSIEILQEETKIFKIFNVETNPEDNEDMLELHPQNCNRWFDENKPLDTVNRKKSQESHD